MATTRSTVHEKVLVEARSRIAAELSTPFSNVGVFRSRAEALKRDELPAVIVKPGGRQSEKISVSRVRHTFQVIVEIHSKATGADDDLSADQVADPIVLAVNDSLFRDKTLGRLVAELQHREMQEPQFIDADETRVVIVLVFDAVFVTSDSDLSSQINH